MPVASGSATYRAVVVGAIGKRYVTETYRLHLSRKSRDAIDVRTLESQGFWEAAGGSLQYDSSHPKTSDPWPASIQYAISRIPCELNLNQAGAPIGLNHVDQWKESAWLSIRDLGLPESAKRSVEAMLEPKSVIENLQRDFPGVPVLGTPWNRTIHIAGVTVPVQQTCTHRRERRVDTYTCQGTVSTAGNARGQLFDLNTSTHITTDTLGVVTHQFAYDGVLVRANSAGVLSHHAIAGKREVSREFTPKALQDNSRPDAR